MNIEKNNCIAEGRERRGERYKITFSAGTGTISATDNKSDRK